MRRIVIFGLDVSFVVRSMTVRFHGLIALVLTYYLTKPAPYCLRQIARAHDRFFVTCLFSAVIKLAPPVRFFIFSRKGAASRSDFLCALASWRETISSRKGSLREQQRNLLRSYCVVCRTPNRKLISRIPNLFLIIARKIIQP